MYPHAVFTTTSLHSLHFLTGFSSLSLRFLHLPSLFPIHLHLSSFFTRSQLFPTLFVIFFYFFTALRCRLVLCFNSSHYLSAPPPMSTAAIRAIFCFSSFSAAPYCSSLGVSLIVLALLSCLLPLFDYFSLFLLFSRHLPIVLISSSGACSIRIMPVLCCSLLRRSPSLSFFTSLSVADYTLLSGRYSPVILVLACFTPLFIVLLMAHGFMSIIVLFFFCDMTIVPSSPPFFSAIYHFFLSPSLLALLSAPSSFCLVLLPYCHGLLRTNYLFTVQLLLRCLSFYSFYQCVLLLLAPSFHAITIYFQPCLISIAFH